MVGRLYPLGILNLLILSRYADTDACLTFASTGSSHSKTRGDALAHPRWSEGWGLDCMGLGPVNVDTEELAGLVWGSMGALRLLVGIEGGGLGDGLRFPLPLPFCLAARFLGEGSDESLVCVYGLLFPFFLDSAFSVLSLASCSACSAADGPLSAPVRPRPNP